MSSSLQNLLIVAGVGILLALGYYLFAQKDTSTLQNAEVNNMIAAESAVFLRKLKELESIAVDQSFFSDPRFLQLIDVSTSIVPMEVGKPNPFVKTR